MLPTFTRQASIEEEFLNQWVVRRWQWSPECNEWVAEPIVLVINKEAATEVKREWLYGETNKSFIVER